MNLSKEKTKDFIAGLIALIFVVSAGYLALNKFNINEDLLNLGTGGQAETSSASDVRGEENENVAGANDSSADTGISISEWKANDYVKGDISSGSYTVKDGDTLWEIAEAVYGDGFMWTEILAANSANVDFLPDGSQALIYAGQTLTIP